MENMLWVLKGCDGETRQQEHQEKNFHEEKLYHYPVLPCCQSHSIGLRQDAADHAGIR
jgi:hypothetical protein